MKIRIAEKTTLDMNTAIFLSDVHLCLAIEANPSLAGSSKPASPAAVLAESRFSDFRDSFKRSSGHQPDMLILSAARIALRDGISYYDFAKAFTNSPWIFGFDADRYRRAVAESLLKIRPLREWAKRLVLLPRAARNRMDHEFGYETLNQFIAEALQ